MNDTNIPLTDEDKAIYEWQIWEKDFKARRHALAVGRATRISDCLEDERRKDLVTEKKRF